MIDSSEMVLRSVHEVFDKWLGLPAWFVDVVAGTVIANRMPGPAVRLALVGENGSRIEEVIESLSGLKNVLLFDSLTPERLQGKLERTRSGLGPLICFKQPITTLGRSGDTTSAKRPGRLKRDKQLDSLTEITKEAGLDGRVGVIASCPGRSARRLLTEMEAEPFLLLRACNSLGERAASNKSAMRRELKNAMSVIDSIQVPSDVPVSDDVRQWLAQLSDFVTRLRTPVPRDPKTREVTDLPAVASTDHLAKQFAQLIKGVAVVRGLDQPYDDEVKLIERVALGSVPPERLRIVQQLGRWRCGRVRPLSVLAGISKTVAHRILQDLRLLKLVKHSPRYGFVPADDFHLLFAVAARRLADEYPTVHQQLA